MSHQNLTQTFTTEVTTTSEQWLESVDGLSHGSELDLKTKALCYLSALAAARRPNEVPFRAARARALGATRDEVIGAVLVGLRAVDGVAIEHPLRTFDAVG